MGSTLYSCRRCIHVYIIKEIEPSKHRYCRRVAASGISSKMLLATGLTSTSRSHPPNTRKSTPKHLPTPPKQYSFRPTYTRISQPHRAHSKRTAILHVFILSVLYLQVVAQRRKVTKSIFEVSKRSIVTLSFYAR